MGFRGRLSPRGKFQSEERRREMSEKERCNKWSWRAGYTTVPKSKPQPCSAPCTQRTTVLGYQPHAHMICASRKAEEIEVEGRVIHVPGSVLHWKPCAVTKNSLKCLDCPVVTAWYLPPEMCAATALSQYIFFPPNPPEAGGLLWLFAKESYELDGLMWFVSTKCHQPALCHRHSTIISPLYFHLGREAWLC